MLSSSTAQGTLTINVGNTVQIKVMRTWRNQAGNTLTDDVTQFADFKWDSGAGFATIDDFGNIDGLAAGIAQLEIKFRDSSLDPWDICRMTVEVKAGEVYRIFDKTLGSEYMPAQDKPPSGDVQTGVVYVEKVASDTEDYALRPSLTPLSRFKCLGAKRVGNAAVEFSFEKRDPAAALTIRYSLSIRSSQSRAPRLSPIG